MWTISFSLTAPIHAAFQKLSTTLLINRSRPNVEFKFNSAFCSEISQYHAQIEVLLWTVLCWFSSDSSFLVAALEL
jgi:hypothetical protein